MGTKKRDIFKLSETCNYFRPYFIKLKISEDLFLYDFVNISPKARSTKGFLALAPHFIVSI